MIGYEVPPAMALAGAKRLGAGHDGAVDGVHANRLQGHKPECQALFSGNWLDAFKNALYIAIGNSAMIFVSGNDPQAAKLV